MTPPLAGRARRRAVSALAALLAVVTLTAEPRGHLRAGLGPLAHADAAAFCAPGKDALECFASSMAAGQWDAAWGALTAADQEAIPRKTWAARYQRLAEIAWVAAVLRSARVENGRFLAADWTHTRFARAGVLRDAGAVGALPQQSYGLSLQGERVSLGEGHRQAREKAPAPGEESARVQSPDADWFARYASVSAACQKGQRFILARLEGEGVRDSLAIDCRGAGLDEVVVWAHVPSKTFKRTGLGLRVEGATSLRMPHPFAAPPPSLLAHAAFPILP